MSKRGNNEGTIRKRPDGRLGARVSVDGAQRSFYGKTREDVARRMRDAHRAVDTGVPLTNERVTVATFLAEWLETSVKVSVRPRTYASYSRHVRSYLVPAIGNLTLVTLRPEHVQRLLPRAPVAEAGGGRQDGRAVRGADGRRMTYDPEFDYGRPA